MISLKDLQTELTRQMARYNFRPDPILARSMKDLARLIDTYSADASKLLWIAAPKGE